MNFYDEIRVLVATKIMLLAEKAKKMKTVIITIRRPLMITMMVM
jgi:hypothetical protein